MANGPPCIVAAPRTSSPDGRRLRPGAGRQIRSRGRHAAVGQVRWSADHCAPQGGQDGRLRHDLRSSLATPATTEVLRPSLPYVDYFVPSIEDASTMSGHSKPEDVARFFLDLGVGSCLLTMGGDGCLVATADGMFRLPAFDIDVTDTTGCGDAFTAGLIAALNHGWDMRNPRVSPRLAARWWRPGLDPTPGSSVSKTPKPSCASRPSGQSPADRTGWLALYPSWLRPGDQGGAGAPVEADRRPIVHETGLHHQEVRPNASASEPSLP